MIGFGVFSYCDVLERIVVEVDNPIYDSRDNCNAIIETSSNALLSGCKNTVIPNSVTSIYSATFLGCSGLTSMTIPNSVTSIDSRVFEGCSNLITVIVGNGVNSIGVYAFSGCSSLKDFYCFVENIPTISYPEYKVFSEVNLSSATLHVPAASLEVYSITKPWSNFGQIVAIGEGDGIEQLVSENLKNPTSYDLNGRRAAKKQKGINILRNADGRVKKVLRK